MGIIKNHWWWRLLVDLVFKKLVCTARNKLFGKVRLRKNFEYFFRVINKLVKKLVNKRKNCLFFVLNEFVNFALFLNFFRIFSHFWKYHFRKIQGYNCETMSWISEKFLSVISNLVTKRNPKFVIITSFFKISKKNFNDINPFTVRRKRTHRNKKISQKKDFRITWYFQGKSFWSRWFQIWCWIFKIQDGRSNTADLKHWKCLDLNKLSDI